MRGRGEVIRRGARDRHAAAAGGAVEVNVCLTVTLIDGLVLARSAFHHSMNYRSVVVLGKARLVADPHEKLEALRAFPTTSSRGDGKK